MAGSAGIRAGRGFVELGLNDNKFVNGLKRAQMKMKAFAGSIGALGGSMTRLGIGIAAPLALATKAFATFENNMAKVSTMLTDPDKWMPQFSEGIKSMMQNFGGSSDELSDALYSILSACVPAANALDVLEVSQRAAVAGMTDVATSSKAIVTVLNAYGLAADQAGNVSDLLFSIVKKGQTDFESLAGSIGKVATVAAAAGVSTETLGAMIATITRTGLSTDETMTAITAAISAFLKPSKEAADAFRELTGMEMNPQTLQQLGGLEGIFNMMKDMSPDEIAKIFPNIRAIKGILPALKQLGSFNADLEEMKNGAGATEEAFEKMSKTLTMKLKKLWGSLKVVAIEIGENLAPYVQQFAVYAEVAVKVIARFIKHNGHLIVMLGGLSLSLLVIGGTLKLLSLGFLMFAKVLGIPILLIKGLAAVIMTLVSPMGLMIGLLGGAGVAFVKFTEAGQRAKEKTAETFKDIMNTSSLAIGGIKDAIAAGDIQLATDILIQGLKTLWSQFWGWMSLGWANMQNEMSGTLDKVKTGAQGLLNHIWGGVERIGVNFNAWWNEEDQGVTDWKLDRIDHDVTMGNLVLLNNYEQRIKEGEAALKEAEKNADKNIEEQKAKLEELRAKAAAKLAEVTAQLENAGDSGAGAGAAAAEQEISVKIPQLDAVNESRDNWVSSFAFLAQGMGRWSRETQNQTEEEIANNTNVAAEELKQIRKNLTGGVVFQ